MSITYEIIKSWNDRDGNVNSMETIMEWVKSRNENLHVSVEKVDFSYDGFWFFDETDGWVRNKNNSFFQLAGFRSLKGDDVICEQPVIIQDEIGYLGIICKIIDGTLNFLMQAKIEPGNINVIQISPTIQATKSNFTRKHGGASPAYLEFFTNAHKHKIIVDQLQSEQSSRFRMKRNRNTIILVEDDVEVYSSHMWMTLGQIKECLKIDNLVNMDTRTVLSCIPFLVSELVDGEKGKIESMFRDKALLNSMFKDFDLNLFNDIYHGINDIKMYSEEHSEVVGLNMLSEWEMTSRGISCKNPYDFQVVYCRIEIEGREVKCWEQPLVEALNISVFGMFTCVQEGIRKFLIKIKPEIGCFDSVELGPTIQLEPSNNANRIIEIENLFLEKLKKKEGIVKDVMLSEEGGRFYHEQNRNVIIDIAQEEIGELPDGYFWADFATINYMIRFNNCVNIQLRNLTALLDIV